MATGLPEYPQFDPDEDVATIPTRWEEWVEGLEVMLQGMAITEHSWKRAQLSHYSGPKCRSIAKHLGYDKNKLYGATDATPGLKFEGGPD